MLRHRDKNPLQHKDEVPMTTPIIARHVSKDYAPLPALEVFIYTGFIVTVFSRAFHAVYEASKEFKAVLYHFNFEEGWSIFSHQDKDIGDFEWTHWRKIFFSPSVLIVLVLHAALGRIVGYVYPKYRTVFLLCFALVSICLFVGLRLLLSFLCYSLLIYTVTCTGSMSTVWCVVLLQIASINFDFLLRFQRYIFTEEDDLNMMVFTVAMCSLRHISFAYEFCHYHSTPVAKRPDEKQYWSLLNFLLYVYYLPLFFGGPILTYDKFSKQINLRIHMLNAVEWKHILKELFRYIFWAMFMEITLHFLYFPAFHQRSTLLNGMSLWAVALIKMSFDSCRKALESLCRVCERKVHSSKKLKEYATLKYRKELLAVFDVNSYKDEEEIHPKHVGRRCLRKVQHYMPLEGDNTVLIIKKVIYYIFV